MEEPKEPFAPHPVSLAPTELKLGSWFQKREKVAQALGVVAAVAGLNYLAWRVLWTSDQSWWTFAPFFAAEIFGYLSFLIFLLDSWKVEPTPRRTPLNLSVDIVIPTYNGDVDILEPTIIGALAVRGYTKVWLLDDNRRPEMKELANRYGIEYRDRPNNDHAKAGNINASLNHYSKGAVISFMHQYIAGLKSTAPAYKSFVVKPILGPQVNDVDLKLDSPQGRIEVEWHRRDGKLSLRVLVPAGSTATAELPDGTQHALVAGENSLSCSLQ